MNFEWDANKNASNLNKHGFDFDVASEVFDDPNCKVVCSRVESGENRFLGIGEVWSYEGKFLLTVVFTHRGNTIRIISAREATQRERKVYEG